MLLLARTRNSVVWDFPFVLLHKLFNFENFPIVELEQPAIVLLEDLVEAWAVFRIVAPARVDQVLRKRRERARDFSLLPAANVDDVEIPSSFSPPLSMRNRLTPN